MRVVQGSIVSIYFSKTEDSFYIQYDKIYIIIKYI